MDVALSSKNRGTRSKWFEHEWSANWRCQLPRGRGGNFRKPSIFQMVVSLLGRTGASKANGSSTIRARLKLSAPPPPGRRNDFRKSDIFSKWMYHFLERAGASKANGSSTLRARIEVVRLPAGAGAFSEFLYMLV